MDVVICFEEGLTQANRVQLGAEKYEPTSLQRKSNRIYLSLEKTWVRKVSQTYHTKSISSFSWIRACLDLQGSDVFCVKMQHKAMRPTDAFNSTVLPAIDVGNNLFLISEIQIQGSEGPTERMFLNEQFFKVFVRARQSNQLIYAWIYKQSRMFCLLSF